MFRLIQIRTRNKSRRAAARAPTEYVRFAWSSRRSSDGTRWEPAESGRFMADSTAPNEQELSSAATKKKRGRPAKTRRNDPEPTPADGNYRPLDLVNKDPKMEYLWAVDDDLGRLKWEGWTPETWGPSCARSPWDLGERQAGEGIKYRELTLMKISKSRRDQIEAAKRSPFHQQLAAVKSAAEATGGYMRPVAIGGVRV